MRTVSRKKYTMSSASACTDGLSSAQGPTQSLNEKGERDLVLDEVVELSSKGRMTAGCLDIKWCTGGSGVLRLSHTGRDWR